MLSMKKKKKKIKKQRVKQKPLLETDFQKGHSPCTLPRCFRSLALRVGGTCGSGLKV